MQKPGKLIQYLQNHGFTNSRNVFWSWYTPYNFGDWVGPYLYKQISGKEPLFLSNTAKLPATAFFAAGSIMRKIMHDDTAIVWGSGVISMSDTFSRPRKIYSVRGPYTQKRCEQLGIACPENYGDPALLLPHYIKPPASPKKKFAVGVIPHFVDKTLVPPQKDPRITIIDVTQPLPQVVQRILECERTISSSLHGLITSHAYGIPSAWIKLSNQLEGDDTKFLDHFASIDIRRPDPHYINLLNEAPNFDSLIYTIPQPDFLIATQKTLHDTCPFPKG